MGRLDMLLEVVGLGEGLGAVGAGVGGGQVGGVLGPHVPRQAVLLREAFVTLAAWERGWFG